MCEDPDDGRRHANHLGRTPGNPSPNPNPSPNQVRSIAAMHFSPTPTPTPTPNQGKLEAVQLLLSNAADVNAAAQSGWTALYAAALNGHETIVELLVSNDASGEPTLILTLTVTPTLTTEPDANPDPNPNPNPDPDLDVSRGRHGRG